MCFSATFSHHKVKDVWLLQSVVALKPSYEQLSPSKSNTKPTLSITHRRAQPRATHMPSIIYFYRADVQVVTSYRSTSGDEAKQMLLVQDPVYPTDRGWSSHQSAWPTRAAMWGRNGDMHREETRKEIMMVPSGT